jgi:hypothetical protein
MRFLSLPAPIHLAVATTLAMLPGTAFARSMPAIPVQAASNSASQPLATIVAEAAHRFGIPEGWIWAVMRVESAGQTHTVSSAGAQGLMQIMPATWTRLRARHGLGDDPFDARDNVLAGASYLREMYDRYGSVTAMLAAYNAGPGRYEAYAAGARGLPLETTRYVARIAPAIRGGVGRRACRAEGKSQQYQCAEWHQGHFRPESGPAVSEDSEFRVRPGKAKRSKAQGRNARGLVAEVLRVAAIHSGGRRSRLGIAVAASRTFGRGRTAFARSRLFGSGRRVMVKMLPVTTRSRGGGAWRRCPRTSPI